MKRLGLLVLIPIIIPLFRACNEDNLQVNELERGDICYNPKPNQIITVYMDYVSYTGKVSEISEDDIIISMDRDGINYMVIFKSQIKGLIVVEEHI